MRVFRVEKSKFLKYLESESYSYHTSIAMQIKVIHNNLISFSDYPQQRVQTMLNIVKPIKCKYLYFKYAYYDDIIDYLICSNSFNRFRFKKCKAKVVNFKK